MITRAARFRVGQVVCIIDGEWRRPMYGRIKATNDNDYWTVELWDADNGTIWEWNYETSDMRPLTKRERGQ